jgi:hypothetical protein
MVRQPGHRSVNERIEAQIRAKKSKAAARRVAVAEAWLRADCDLGPQAIAGLAKRFRVMTGTIYADLRAIEDAAQVLGADNRALSNRVGVASRRAGG